MKTVILIFSHNTLSRRWRQLVPTCAEQGIELIVLSQNAGLNWSQFIEEKGIRSDVLYLDFTSHCPAYALLLECAQKHPFAIAANMEISGDMGGAHEKQADVFKQYLSGASLEDLVNGIHYLLHAAGHESSPPAPPGEPLLCAIGDPITMQSHVDVEAYLEQRRLEAKSPRSSIVPILYGRRYWINDDMGLIEDLFEAVEQQGFTALPIYCDFSLGNKINHPDHPLAKLLLPLDNIVAIFNLAFSSPSGEMRPDQLFNSIGKPVFQLIRDYSQTEEQWKQSNSPLIGMTYNFSIAQPEVLGTIEPHLIACNAEDRSTMQNGETPLAKPVSERLHRLMTRLKRWSFLQTANNAEKRVAIVLHNSPCKGVEATLASAAGMDAAQSAVELMRRLAQEGYDISDIPESGKALLQLIQKRKAHCEFRWTHTNSIVANGGVIARVNEASYRKNFSRMDASVQTQMNDAWEPFPGKAMVHPNEQGEPELLIVGLNFGKITVLIEPKRGCWGPKCDGEVCRILHQPDIAPTHHWMATAWYIQENFDVLVQMGTGSAMEYLPGKPVALGENCFPDMSLGELPRLYPYIMDSIGEGLLAKRRGKGIVINHLTPPVRRLGDESTASEPMIEIHQQWLHAQENGHQQRENELFSQLKIRMLASGFIEKDVSESDLKEAIIMLPRRLQRMRTRLLEAGKHVLGRVPDEAAFELYAKEAESSDAFSPDELREKLAQTGDEMNHLIAGLNGRFIPSGQAGSITSGREDLLPTGRNFYGINLRSIPTPSAWKVGADMGKRILDKYLLDEGKFPKSIGITLWSSDAFMAEGELTSQCLWLLGCRPIWNAQGKVSGIEVTPLEEMTHPSADGTTLDRPRIDIVVRMSGVVRDLLEPIYLLVDDAVTQVSELHEPLEQNYVRKHVEERLEELEQELSGIGESSLRRLATGRIFTDRDGSYGAGVGLAVDASAWNNEKDLANAYVNWTGGLCGRNMATVVKKVGLKGVMKEFSQQMKGIDIAYQKAISEKYDALSISCYTGYQGGMAVTQRAMGGKRLKLYWGDSQSGNESEVRDLADEVDLALTARFLSPEWLEEKMQEGYAGANTLSSMVNTLFAWSATTGVVKKKHFDLVTRKLIEDPRIRDWFIKNNLYAMEEITRRLMEANERSLWAADPESLKHLMDATLQLEGEIEDTLGTVTGEFQGSSVDIKTQTEVKEWKWEWELESSKTKT